MVPRPLGHMIEEKEVNVEVMYKGNQESLNGRCEVGPKWTETQLVSSSPPSCFPPCDPFLLYVPLHII